MFVIDKTVEKHAITSTTHFTATSRCVAATSPIEGILSSLALTYHSLSCHLADVGYTMCTSSHQSTCCHLVDVVYIICTRSHHSRCCKVEDMWYIVYQLTDVGFTICTSSQVLQSGKCVAYSQDCSPHAQQVLLSGFFFLLFFDISSFIGAVNILQFNSTISTIYYFSIYINTLTQDSLPQLLATKRHLVVDYTATYYINLSITITIQCHNELSSFLSPPVVPGSWELAIYILPHGNSRELNWSEGERILCVTFPSIVRSLTSLTT